MRKSIFCFRFIFMPFLAGALFFVGGIAHAELLSEEKAVIDVFERVSPSVVFIKNAALQLDWFSDSLYEVPQGAGSGFVWDTDGHIVTNFHVIYQADSIEVSLGEGQSFKAEVVGFSPDYEIAVLKIDAPKEKLKPIDLGETKSLKVGQKAISIGNPFGLDYSLSCGVVSALGRSIKTLTAREIHDVIQTDAAINPGNSGGPLLDSSGKLIGVSTAIYSTSGSSAGVGFAIPVDVVKRVVPQLIKYGHVRRVGLGIVLVPDAIRQRLRVKGAMILDLARNSPAYNAGLNPTRRGAFGSIVYGDVIISVDDNEIKDNDGLVRYLEEKKPGDVVDIKFLRNNKEYGTKATLQLLEE